MVHELAQPDGVGVEQQVEAIGGTAAPPALSHVGKLLGRAHKELVTKSGKMPDELTDRQAVGHTIGGDGFAKTRRTTLRGAGQLFQGRGRGLRIEPVSGNVEQAGETLQHIVLGATLVHTLKARLGLRLRRADHQMHAGQHHGRPAAGLARHRMQLQPVFACHLEHRLGGEHGIGALRGKAPALLRSTGLHDERAHLCAEARCCPLGGQFIALE